MNRRNFLGYGATAVIAAVVGGAAVYALAPRGTTPGPTETVTKTVGGTETVTKTVGGGETVTKTVTGPASTATVTKTQTPQAGGTVNFITSGHCQSFYTGFLLDEFSKSQGITLNPTIESFPVLHDKLATAFAAGAYTYDLTYMFWLPEFNQFLMPLDEAGIQIPQEMIDDMMGYAKVRCVYNGKWYGLPRLESTLVMHSNKEHLAAAGFGGSNWSDTDYVPIFPESFEEWIECLDALKKKYAGVKDYYPFAAGFMQGYSIPHYFCWLHANGGSFWKNDDRRTINCDSAESIKAVEDMVMLYDNYIDPAATEWIFSVQPGPAFYTEKASFMMYHPHATGVNGHPESGYPMAKKASCYTWIIPGHRGVARSGSMEACEFYTIPKTCKNIKGAWELMKFFNSRTIQAFRVLTNGPAPPNEEDYSPMYSHFYDPQLRSSAWVVNMLEASLTQLKYRSSRYPDRPAYQECANAVEAGIANALKKVKTPEDAMKEAAEACDNIVEKEYTKYGGKWPDAWDAMNTDAERTKIDNAIKELKKGISVTG